MLSAVTETRCSAAVFLPSKKREGSQKEELYINAYYLAADMRKKLYEEKT